MKSNDSNSQPEPRRPGAVTLTVARAMIVNGVFQALTLAWSWVLRDGGGMLRLSLAAAAAYWAMTTWVLVRRRGTARPSHGELMFMTIGFLLLVIAGYAGRAIGA